MTAQQVPPPDITQPFITWLEANDDGDTARNLTEALREVTRLVLELDKVGSVVLTVKVRPGEAAREIVMAAAVVAKPPAPTVNSTIWYADKALDLSPEPKQDPLFPVGKR